MTPQHLSPYVLIQGFHIDVNKQESETNLTPTEPRMSKAKGRSNIPCVRSSGFCWQRRSRTSTTSAWPIPRFPTAPRAPDGWYQKQPRDLGCTPPVKSSPKVINYGDQGSFIPKTRPEPGLKMYQNNPFPPRLSGVLRPLYTQETCPRTEDLTQAYHDSTLREPVKISLAAALSLHSNS